MEWDKFLFSYFIIGNLLESRIDFLENQILSENDS